MGPELSPRRGSMRNLSRGCLRNRRPQLLRLATPASKASTWLLWRTRLSSTTWSSARCAPAIRGQCWGFRRSGTNRRPTARGRSWTPEACCAISAWNFLPTRNSACGIRPPRDGISYQFRSHRGVAVITAFRKARHKAHILPFYVAILSQLTFEPLERWQELRRKDSDDVDTLLPPAPRAATPPRLR